jgi:hypothetical protein
METLIIEITDKKAYQFLQGLEDLKLIKMMRSATISPRLQKNTGISALPKKIKSPMKEADINNQLNKLRDEWQRDT